MCPVRERWNVSFSYCSVMAFTFVANGMKCEKLEVDNGK